MAFHPSKSLRAAATAFALTALALLVLAGGSLAAGKACKGKTQPWKVNGKSVCLKTARPAAGHAAAESSSRIKRWFSGPQTTAGRKPFKVPAKLLNSRKQAAAVAVKLFAVAAQMKSRQRVARAFASTAGSHGAVVETLSQDGPSVTLDSGVVLSSHVDGTAYADGSQSIDGYVSATLGAYQVQYRPIYDLSTTLVPEVECPTADGKLTIEHKNTFGGTVTALKGRTVLGAFTQKTTQILKARGQVGRDAHLASVVSTVTEKNEYYARGSQAISSVTGTFNIPREGNPVQQGPLTADVKLKVAGATSRQEREGEREAAANLAASANSASAIASHAELARWRMMQDEHKWYDWPYMCASVYYDPDSVATLAAGKSLAISARVEAHAGGEAAGSIALESVGTGKVSIDKAEVDPGAPAKLTATAAAPNSEKYTVESKMIAASTAGRAQGGWYAKDDLNLPEKISGVVATWSEIPGASYTYFHSWVVYTLKNVYVSDGGYISAFYDLTTADQDEVENTIGPSAGCRYVAKGSGGNIEAGDLELRKPPGGEWSHAIMYDVEVPDQVYTPTDCGPSPPPAFNGDVVGFLNMAMLGGSGFYPVEDNFHFQQTAVSHTDPASGRKTTADWILDPGDPQ